MSDITKFVYKEVDDSDIFYVDFEDYETGIVNTHGYESGDVVLFVWDNIKYRGTLYKCSYDDDSIFEIKNVKIRQ